MPLALLFDRSDRARLRLSGTHAVATLNGLVTNDVAALAPGRGAYAAVLTAKGKIIADVRVFVLSDGILVDTSPEAAAGLRETFRKYVNPRFASVTDVSDSLSDLGVFGEHAAEVVTRAVAPAAGGTAAESRTPTVLPRTLDWYGHFTADVGGTPVTVARTPDLGTDGYDLFVPNGRVLALRDALLAAGATPADGEAWRAMRVAAGRPAWGVDMDDTTLLQEANLDALGAVSYSKGCYVGQETVARIHFRGHVNRALRRLAIDGTAEPPRGTELKNSDGAVVGDVRSVARQPDGTLLGIGMVRREVHDGATLTARWEGHEGGGGETTMSVLKQATGNAKGAVV